MNVNEKSVASFVSEWKKIKPSLLYGHAHSLFTLAKHLDAMEIDSIKPKGILSTSMMLMPNERKVIERIFEYTGDRSLWVRRGRPDRLRMRTT